MASVDRRSTLGVAVLTLNEATRIEACLRSAAFADQIVAIDSGSTDGTREIAERLGAQVHLYPEWQGFGVQRTRAIEHLHTDYIFYLDADEVISPALRTELTTAVASKVDAVWRVWWDEVAFGKALPRMKPRGGIRRLFMRSTLERFDGVVHETPILRHQVPVQDLQQRLLHLSRTSVYDSLRKLTQYVQLGTVKRRAKGRRGGVLLGMVNSMLVFVRIYFLQRAFLCGPQGFLYSFFIALEILFRDVALVYDTPNNANLARR